MSLSRKDKIRDAVLARPRLARFVMPIVVALRHVQNLMRYGMADPVAYYVFKGRQLVYLVNPKVAQTTITNTAGNPIKKEYSSLQEGDYGHKTRTLTADEQSGYLFTFVRNPYARLYSCYRSKLIADKVKYNRPYGDFDFYLFGYISRDEGFATFVRKITKIPYRLADRHFKPQHFALYTDNTLPIAYVGRFENLQDDFEPVRTAYDLDPLPHLNPSKTTVEDWRDAYTPELIDLVASYYEADLSMWYPDATKELRAHVNRVEHA